MSEVSIIIVNYKSEGFLPSCLESLRRSTSARDIEVILVDNSKGAGAGGVLREYFPQGRLIENDRNLGYARAVNQGISASGSEFIFVVNPDTVAEEGSLERLIEFMKTHPEAGIVAPKLLNADGTDQLSCRRFYTLKTLVLRRTFLGKIFKNSPSVKRHLMQEWDHNCPAEVDWVIGAAMLVRKAAISDVGPMDERFFLYFEDVDWCYRMKAAGWKTYYYPESRLVHHYRRQSAEARFGKAKRAHLESWLRFYEKWSLLLYVLKRNRELVSKAVLLVADVAVLTLAFYLAYLLRANLGFMLKKPTPPFEVYRSFMLLAVIVGIGSIAYVGLYGKRKMADWIDLLFDVSKAMVLTSLILMASTFLLYVKIYSRAAVLMLLPISVLILTTERFVFRLIQRKLALTRVNVRRILIVGSGAVADRARNAVLKGAEEGVELAGFVDTDGWFTEGSREPRVEPERIWQVAHAQRAGEVILADSPSRIDAIWPLASELPARGVQVTLATELGVLLGEGDRIEEMGGLGFVSLKRRPAPRGVAKRAIELLLTLPASVLLIPLAMVGALCLVAMRRKPVFLKQDLEGEYGESLRVWRLNCKGGSPIERLLVATGLCSAPLLLSVLSGRLALVGLRPRARPPAQEAKPTLRGKPGVFGIWKLAESPAEADRGDTEYLATWSISLDLKTIARCLLRRRLALQERFSEEVGS